MSDTNAATAKENQRPSFWGRGAYELFIESEGIPIYTGADVPDLRSVRVAAIQASVSACRRGIRSAGSATTRTPSPSGSSTGCAI